ncbi:serine kinase [Paracoccus suum]|uniref:Serine kinase n=1 Tax=Paracoccus suum TaxID=2259340 RepID=A0A344PIW4_9RHOB|nr:HPr kinase/phosphatase C-terminal domain-containing protein [Paracoccus suum]AXC49319.1 serine kinase [Paracoccus suum]
MMVHGSCVAIGGRAVLITGPSGAGKSALALALMAIGAGLVADDQTVLVRHDDAILADAPPSLRGRIEARHVGILGAEPVGPAAVTLVVDLGGPRSGRLPQDETVEMLGLRVPCLAARAAPELAPALRQFLIGGRLA